MYVNLVIKKGATFKKSMLYQDKDGNAIDLTGFTAEMQIRTGYGEEPIISTLTTENGKIILGGVLGSVDLLIGKEETKTFPVAAKDIYDLELLSPADEVIRLIEGNVMITDNVTIPGL